MEAKNFIEEIINKDLESGKISCVKTRFPPEPNGYLHIGHAKALCVNFGLKQKYGGTCNLRYDDTNPVKEDEEYVNAIEEDIRWLGFEWDEKLFASDYFDRMFECAVGLIKKGLAYVCDLSAEQIRETRGTLTSPGRNSPFRNRSVEENLDLFMRMKAGEFADGEKVLRAKNRHGVKQSQYARPRHIPRRARKTSQHGRQVVRLSDVRLCASHRGRFGGNNPLRLHA